MRTLHSGHGNLSIWQLGRQRSTHLDLAATAFTEGLLGTVLQLLQQGLQLRPAGVQQLPHRLHTHHTPVNAALQDSGQGRYPKSKP